MSSFILAREICFQATWENGAPVLKYKNAAKQDVYNVNIVCASQLLASIIAICVRCIEALPLLSTYNQAQCRIVLGSCACKDRLEHCIFCSDLCSLCRASRVVQPCSTTFGCCDTRSVARVVHALQRSGPSLSSRVGDGWVSFRPTYLGSISRWEAISCVVPPTWKRLQIRMGNQLDLPATSPTDLAVDLPHLVQKDNLGERRKRKGNVVEERRWMGIGTTARRSKRDAGTVPK